MMMIAQELQEGDYIQCKRFAERMLEMPNETNLLMSDEAHHHLNGYINKKNCVCVCVCVPMPTHCTITCFGFHASWIDGIKCGLFSNHALFGQTTLRVG